jgi:hypothetical protein
LRKGAAAEGASVCAARRLYGAAPAQAVGSALVRRLRTPRARAGDGGALASTSFKHSCAHQTSDRQTSDFIVAARSEVTT